MEHFSVCLIQPANYVHSQGLLEVCQLLCCSLESIGLPCRFQTNRIEPDAINIVVGYHLLDPPAAARLAAARLILYQLEQLSDREGWFSREREAVLRAAWAIWDYSPENVAFLKNRGFPRVEYLPLGFHPALRRILHPEDSDRNIDVLFYGSLNPRRAAILEALRRQCRAHALFGVYGETRDRYIARARILLNIHFYQAAILEQVRLAYLLNNECFVISEEAGHNPFAGGIVTGPYAKLVSLCETYLAQPESRKQVAARGFRDFASRPMTEYLQPLLLSLTPACGAIP